MTTPLPPNSKKPRTINDILAEFGLVKNVVFEPI
jgi:hypothetical protein